ncbi:tetratricopeptide repeat protein 12-like [Ischnura elegans]|uniref:tetratricopeptide repeat protein 12-like n=1 Tax=Ischnura elegans TaxID=197161 RepID=UPI001ED87F3B|nr:tetratricopeptide repeat protein 12-like [Ischnura elegans]
MPKEDREFESFMERVDKIGSIISRLTSKEESVREEAAKEADLCLEGKKVKGDIDEGACKIKQNRTVINKKAFEDENGDQYSPSKEVFMAMVSKDADERYQRKKERERKAKKWTQDAEKSKQGEDYETALYQYTKAIDEQVNWPKLFAERAKVLLKLKLKKRAIEDCDKALKLNEDLLFLKGENATDADKTEANLLSTEIESIKEEVLALTYTET